LNVTRVTEERAGHFHVDRDAEAARGRLVEKGAQVGLSLVILDTRPVPRDHERVDARGLGLVNLPAHSAAVA
jgi:hypothetical protein